MKTKPTKIDRSAAKWLPGAMALAATTASTQAAVVQITLTGNKISTSGDNTLNADVTGDNSADLVFANPLVVKPGFSAYKAFVSINGNGLSARIFFGDSNAVGDAQFATRGIGTPNTNTAPLSFDIKYLNPISFRDARINNNALTHGWLEVNSVVVQESSATVQLTRLIFDDESTTRPAFGSIPGVQTEWQVAAVPEPSGFLATSLLLGAAGLIRRRQARVA